MHFDQAFDLLMGHEGVYSNHPADNGGATTWGITERVARASGYQGDMRDMPRDLAKSIYRKDYWAPIRADELPIEIRFDMFDFAVNSGPVKAVETLQRLLKIRMDGVVGPETLAAAAKATNLRARLSGHRLMYMTHLSDWTHFGKGWARRIATNLMRDA